MLAVLKSLLKDQNAATAIEYGLIAALVSVAMVTVLSTVGANLTGTFSTVARKLWACRKCGRNPPVSEPNVVSRPGGTPPPAYPPRGSIAFNQVGNRARSARRGWPFPQRCQSG